MEQVIETQESDSNIIPAVAEFIVSDWHRTEENLESYKHEKLSHMVEALKLEYASKIADGTYSDETAVKGLAWLVKQGFSLYRRVTEGPSSELGITLEQRDEIARQVLASLKFEIELIAEEIKEGLRDHLGRVKPAV